MRQNHGTPDEGPNALSRHVSDELGGLEAPEFGATTRDVHRRTRNAILEGVLRPGQQLSQVELARRLHVSRTPLREALRMLEREGLIVVRGAHRMVQISALSMVDLDELYTLRVITEAVALRLTVPTLGAADFAALHADLDTMLSHDPGELVRHAHQRFHRRLRAGVDARMQETLETLFEHAERYRRAYVGRGPDSRRQKNTEHRLILAACEARDADLAVDLLVDHMASTALTLMAAERYAARALPVAVLSARSARQADLAAYR